MPQSRDVQRSANKDPMSDAPWARLGDRPLPAPVIVGGVEQRRGVIYSSIPGFRPLELDIYAPAQWAGESRPLVVWIHGGAFALGTRQILPEFLAEADFFAALTRSGFVVASIDYRLSTEAVWPAQLQDVRNAIRWLRANAEQLFVDEASIAVWGESAGAHLAAMAGILGGAERADEPGGLPLPRVAAVIDWYGPTDFASMDAQAPDDSAMTHDAADSPESRLLGAPVQEASALVRDADPSYHVQSNLPPFLIRHGRRDRFVPFGQSVLLADALAESGNDVTFHPVDDADHVFEGYPQPGEFVAEGIAFLRRVLASATPSDMKGRQ